MQVSADTSFSRYLREKAGRTAKVLPFLDDNEGKGVFPAQE
jgi:hypothetical protein